MIQHCFIGNSGVTLTYVGEEGTSAWPDVCSELGGSPCALQLVFIRDARVEYKGDISHDQIQCCKSPLSAPQICRLECKQIHIFMVQEFFDI